MKKGLIGFALSAVLLALSVSAQAQQAKKIPRIGYVSGSGGPNTSSSLEQFQQGLRDLGYIVGHTCPN